jgi:hypothetical protein
MSEVDRSKTPITVTLTAEQWIAVMSYIADHTLTPVGEEMLNEATQSMTDQFEKFTKEYFNDPA